MSNIDPRLYNPLGQVLGMMPPEVQAEMKRIGTAENVDCWGINVWGPCPLPLWYPNLAYRIRPGWTPPEPESGLIEVKPFVDRGAWAIKSPLCGRIGGLEQGPIIIGFRGYRYGSDVCADLRLEHLAKGFRVVIPDAVVFDRAEVEDAK